MKKVIATGRTVEDAVTSALVRLGVTKSQATIRVISEPVKGFFGFIGGKDAEVEVSVKSTPEENAKDFLRGALLRMGIEANIVLKHDPYDKTPTLQVLCSDEVLPVVIGRHGSTLESLQFLVNITANREVEKQEKFVKFYVDAGDYRARRKSDLERIAERAVVRALKSKRAVTLEAMSSADRKVVHTYLQDREDVTTTSEGVDPNRKVVVVPVLNSGPGVSRMHS